LARNQVYLAANPMLNLHLCLQLSGAAGWL